MKTEENNESQKAASEEVAPESVEKATDPVEEWKNRSVYLMAEIENMRKRFTREKAEVIRFANEELVKSVIPVLDNLQLALKAIKEAESRESHPLIAKLLQGVDMTVKHFEQTLERIGVQPVPAVGEIFDPQKHEAIAQSESTEHKSGEVTAEMQKGYSLQGRLIRPARVVVNKTKEV